MDAVWTVDEPVCVRDVLGRLDRDPQPAYTTVQTVMDILFRKGWLSRTKRGRVNYYTASARRDDYVSGLMNEALAETADRTAALVRFVEGMDPAETDTLRRMLSDAQRSAAGADAAPAAGTRDARASRRPRVRRVGEDPLR